MKKYVVFVVAICLSVAIASFLISCNKPSELRLSDVIEMAEASCVEIALNAVLDTTTDDTADSTNAEYILKIGKKDGLRYSHWGMGNHIAMLYIENEYYSLENDEITWYSLYHYSDMGNIDIFAFAKADYEYKTKSEKKGTTDFIFEEKTADVSKLSILIGQSEYADIEKTVKIILRADNKTKQIVSIKRETFCQIDETNSLRLTENWSFNNYNAAFAFPEQVAQKRACRDEILGMIEQISTLNSLECQIVADIDNKNYDITAKYKKAGEYMHSYSTPTNTYSSYTKDGIGYGIKNGKLERMTDNAEDVQLLRFFDDRAHLMYVDSSDYIDQKQKYTASYINDGTQGNSIICAQIAGEEYLDDSYTISFVVDSKTKIVEQIEVFFLYDKITITFTSKNEDVAIDFPHNIGNTSENYITLVNVIEALSKQSSFATDITITKAGNPPYSAWGRFQTESIGYQNRFAAAYCNLPNGYFINSNTCYTYQDGYWLEPTPHVYNSYEPFIDINLYFEDPYIDLDFLRILYNNTADIVVSDAENGQKMLKLTNFSDGFELGKVAQRLDIDDDKLSIIGCTIFYGDNLLPSRAQFKFESDRGSYDVCIDYKQYGTTIAKDEIPDHFNYDFHRIKDEYGLDVYKYQNHHDFFLDESSHTAIVVGNDILSTVIRFYDTRTMDLLHTFTINCSLNDMDCYNGTFATISTQGIHVFDLDNLPAYRTLSASGPSSSKIIVLSDNSIVYHNAVSVCRADVATQVSQTLFDDVSWSTPFIINRQDNILYFISSQQKLVYFDLKNDTIILEMPFNTSFFFDGINVHAQGKLLDALSGEDKGEGDLSSSIPSHEDFVPQRTLFQNNGYALVQDNSYRMGLYNYDSDSYLFISYEYRKISYMSEDFLLLGNDDSNLSAYIDIT